MKVGECAKQCRPEGMRRALPERAQLPCAAPRRAGVSAALSALAPPRAARTALIHYRDRPPLKISPHSQFKAGAFAIEDVEHASGHDPQTPAHITFLHKPYTSRPVLICVGQTLISRALMTLTEQWEKCRNAAVTSH